MTIDSEGGVMGGGRVSVRVEKFLIIRLIPVLQSKDCL